MNNERRDKLRGAMRKLTEVQSIVEVVCDKEEDCLDNYPENLQSTERYEQTEDAVDNLNDALEKLEEAKEHIEAAIR